MKFLSFSTKALAAILASLTVVSASGPSDGDAIAPADSSVVKLSAEAFEDFLISNPLVLAEFFAPWCGYCKQLGPEFATAADSLAKSNPDIKLAQIDCTENQELCQLYDIKGYPTLKVFRGNNSRPEDYAGPRDASGIAGYMEKLALPAVQKVTNYDTFLAAAEAETSPFAVQILPSASHKSAKASNETYAEVASSQRSQMSFYSLEDDESIAEFNKLIDADLSGSSPIYLVIHPDGLDDARVFSGDFDSESFTEFVLNSSVPDFGDINRDTYTLYMNSPLPLAYYFYSSAEERAAMADFLAAEGKKNRGKLLFVGLDASQFGRHAEVLNMDPSVVPLFAIQDNTKGKKYGIDQTKYPEGPSKESISEFVELYLSGEAKPIIKSEPLPTQEEIDAQAVVKLVTHNYDEILGDLSKDVFVKYYAPWCGHCKKLAPVWEELAQAAEGSGVVIADVDHTLNDVDTPMNIEGYPTLILYPANGEIDPKTGMRKAVSYNQGRDLESLMEFVKTSGSLEVDLAVLAAEKAVEVEEEVAEEVAEEIAEEDAAEDHDEL